MIEKRYILNDLKLDVDESLNLIPNKIIKKYRDPQMKILDLKILRESIDARHKPNIKKIYTIEFSTNRELDLPEAKKQEISVVETGNEELRNRPVVVGFGPCGMFAAMELAERGYRPLVIERGYDVQSRVDVVNRFWKYGILDPECNVQFGEGGAGTFSDGKLTTGISDPRKNKILEAFVKAGAPEDILYKSKPHIGSDLLRSVVRNIRIHIESLGGNFIFDARMNRVIKDDNDRVTAIIIQKGYTLYKIKTNVLILAIGHSARDTFRSLAESGLEMEQKPFSIGVRIEHPQSVIDKSQYGSSVDKGYLPHADYKLAYHAKDGRGVYTFCMCPGGHVISASSQTGGVVTNGMSFRERSAANANSGLLVDVRTDDFGANDQLAGVRFQEKYEAMAFKNGGENYKPPKTTWAAFRDGKEEAMPVIKSLPDFAVRDIREAVPEMAKKLKGFDADDAVMSAVESRSSSPIRIIRGADYMSNIKGIYPGGEGAGYAGGIVSSACDGIKIAETIIRKYKPLEEY